MDDFINKYLSDAIEIAKKIDKSSIEKMVDILVELKNSGGRLFILGVGGSSANASHAVNDFRKICGIEAYAPTDNVSELTARVNDEGWSTVFAEWLKISKVGKNDCVMVFSVGGGDAEKNISVNLIEAIMMSKKNGAKIIGVVGRDGGFTAKAADACVIVPVVNNETITPHSEAFQAVIWHLIASHPKLKVNEMKWESTK